MKRMTAGLLALAAAVALAACGGKAVETAAEPVDVQALAQTIGALKDSAGNALFTEPAQPGQDELADVYGIDTALLKDYLILVDKDYNFCMMMVPEDGKDNDVKNMMSTALTQLAQQLELYLPEQCQRVRDRKETLRGDYLIYAATADNDALLAEVEKAVG